MFFFNILSASVFPQLWLKTEGFLHFSKKYSKYEWFCDGGNILTASDFDILSVSLLRTIFFEYSKCESVALHTFGSCEGFRQAVPTNAPKPPSPQVIKHIKATFHLKCLWKPQWRLDWHGLLQESNLDCKDDQWYFLKDELKGRIVIQIW